MTAAPPVTMAVTRIDPIMDARWSAYVGRHPRGTAYFHPGWLAALRAESGGQLIGLACEAADGALTGVLPLMTTRGLPFDVGAHQTRRRIASLPRTPVAGPLADSEAATTLLLEQAVALMDSLPGRVLQLKSESEHLDELVPGLAGLPWRPSYVIDLPEPPARIRFGDARNNSRIRWAVNKATRARVRVREARSEADLRAWYGVYLATMRHHAVPPRPFGFFLSLWRELRPGVLRLLLAEQGDRLLAGSVFLAHAQTVHYAFNGSRREDLGLRPNDAILWRAIHDAAADGRRRFDLGEVMGERSGLAEFKSKWGADEIRLWRYYYPASAAPSRTAPGDGDEAEPTVVRMLRTVWRQLPLGVTEVLGEWVVRRV